jgi:hypothetical protein
MSTTSVATPAPEAQPQSLGAFARIVGVFFSPKSTFEDIARKPSWLVPVALMTIVSLAVCIAINQRVDWREFISQQIEKSPRAAALSPEQKQQQIEAGAKISPVFTYVVGVMGPIVFVLAVTLVMWGAYNLFAGANATWGNSLGIVAHASLPTMISGLLFFLILYIKPPGTVDLENPIATNVAALLPEDSAKWLIALCKSFDVFTIWVLILIAIGFARFNQRKLKGGKAFSIAFSVWAVWILVRVGWAFIFS